MRLDAVLLALFIVVGACSAGVAPPPVTTAARSAPGASASPTRGTTVVTVTTTSDDQNGDVSSPAALKASPGGDGISLREAIAAVNKVPGPHVIRFDDALSGKTITPVDRMPHITRDGITITGPVDAKGDPTVTISGRLFSWAAIWILASDVVVQRLRFIDRSFASPAIRIKGPSSANSAQARAEARQPALLRNIGIYDNVFDNGGADGLGITIGTNDIDRDKVVENVSIARNRFHGFKSDAILVGPAGRNNTVRGLRVYDNTMTATGIAVELVPSGTNNRISGTQIVRNTVIGNVKEPTVFLGAVTNTDSPDGTLANGNIVENTLIAANTFIDNFGPAIMLQGGHGIATGNVVRDTRIANNVIVHTRRDGIVMAGGQEGATQNKVERTEIINNTIVRERAFASLTIEANRSGAANNTVTGTLVRNTIFFGPGSDFGLGDQLRPDRVEHSLTTAPGASGVNGNVAVDPRFVDAAQRDFRLRPGSPAIDAGHTEGAPTADRDGRLRLDDAATADRGVGAVSFTDIGAYEFGSPERALVRVRLAGDSIGTIVSAPRGMDCPTICLADFAAGSPVTFTASPAAGARFTGWRGACSGTGACAVDAGSALELWATFEPDVSAP